MNTELIKKYEAFSRDIRGLSDKTVREYVRTLEYFLPHIDFLAAKKPSDIDEVLVKLETDNNWQRQYTYRMSKIIVTFYKWAVVEEILPFNPYVFSRFRKPRPKDPKHISQKEFDFIITDNPILNQQGEFLMNLLWDTGICREEASFLDRPDIRLDKMNVAIRQETSKGEYRPRILPFTEKTAVLIERQIRVSEKLAKGEHVFMNESRLRLMPNDITKLVTKIGKMKGIEISPHALRHSLAIRMLEGGADIGFVSKFLGHTNINQTIRYLNLLEGSTRALYDRALGRQPAESPVAVGRLA